MADDSTREWQARVGGSSGSGGSRPNPAGVGTATATMPEAPPAAPATGQMPVPPQAEEGKGRKKKKEKAEKEPKAAKIKEPKAPKVKASRSRSTAPADSNWVLSLDDGPSRQELEQVAASEFWAAVTPAYDLLKAEVPDAASPEDAQRKIENELTKVGTVSDVDAGIPKHPIYSGDALVYYQLRRHYGSPNPGGSFRRSWYPLQPR